MNFVFKKKNYILLISGLVLILLGIFLMIGGESEDPTKFSDEIFNFQRLSCSWNSEQNKSSKYFQNKQYYL